MKHIRRLFLTFLLVCLLAPAAVSATRAAQPETMTDELLDKCDAILKEAFTKITRQHFYMSKSKPAFMPRLTPSDLIRSSVDYVMKRLPDPAGPVFGRRSMERIRKYVAENKIETVNDVIRFCRRFTAGKEIARGRRVYDLFVKGFLKALNDPFSTLYDEQAIARLRQSLRGESSPPRFGISPRRKDGKWVVASVPYGYPACDAGIRAGDLVLEVDGKPLAALSETEVARLLGARKGLERTFRIFRKGWERAHDFVIEAKSRPKELIDMDVLPGSIGYVRVTSFMGRAGRNLRFALNELEKEGVKGLVLDLRNDPGGQVNECQQIAQTFLERGKTIAFTRPESIRMPELRSNNRRPVGLPLVLLVNRSSASASEMLSGSLQANGRALVIGERTFGKGIGQTHLTIRASRGDRMLRLTTFGYFLRDREGREWTPNGIGVIPDITVKPKLLAGKKFEAAWKLKESGLIKKYITEAHKSEPKKMYNLAVDDGGAWDDYPDYGTFLKNASEIADELLTRDEIRRRVRRELRSFVAEKENVAFVADPVDDVQLIKAQEILQGLIRGDFTVDDRLAYGYVKYAIPRKVKGSEEEAEEDSRPEPEKEPARPGPKRKKKKPEKGILSPRMKNAA